ncbi:hypothetical protein BC936DRAFT_147021 [Jimgerdemannia flammicorona]|uniref:Uncharacterized protein n=1 Tax=Jimgerdemannia flammicorona TaxID=994334 RepID=A0A433D6A6_9FUNG|nr:hypothetical protein BC936DRAFT_147021 [Jimgerdemannia flammicorona]
MSHLPAEFPNINDLPASNLLKLAAASAIIVYTYLPICLGDPDVSVEQDSRANLEQSVELADAGEASGWLDDYLNHLHDKYGKVVRLGPNNVAFMDKTDIKEVRDQPIKTIPSQAYSLILNCRSSQILVTKDLPKNEAFLKTFRLDPAHSLPLRFYSTHSNHCPHQ